VQHFHGISSKSLHASTRRRVSPVAPRDLRGFVAYNASQPRRPRGWLRRELRLGRGRFGCRRAAGVRAEEAAGWRRLSLGNSLRSFRMTRPRSLAGHSSPCGREPAGAACCLGVGRPEGASTSPAHCAPGRRPPGRRPVRHPRRPSGLGTIFTASHRKACTPRRGAGDLRGFVAYNASQPRRPLGSLPLELRLGRGSFGCRRAAGGARGRPPAGAGCRWGTRCAR
jgi:hypothetical protein